MTARAIRSADGWLRWAVTCPACPGFTRRIRGSRQTAEHVADLHNQHHHPTKEGQK